MRLYRQSRVSFTGIARFCRIGPHCVQLSRGIARGGLFAVHRMHVASFRKTFTPEFQGLLDRSGALFAVAHRYLHPVCRFAEVRYSTLQKTDHSALRRLSIDAEFPAVGPCQLLLRPNAVAVTAA